MTLDLSPNMGMRLRSSAPGPLYVSGNDWGEVRKVASRHRADQMILKDAQASVTDPRAAKTASDHALTVLETRAITGNSAPQ